MELYGSGELGEVFLTAARVGLYTNDHVRLKRLRDAAHDSDLVKVEAAVRRLMNP